MDTFRFYTELGFWHVIDLAGLDHFFFITTLAVPFAFSQSRKLLWWVTLFTLGHTFSLMGNVYAEIIFSSYLIELLIPVTIGLGATPLLLRKGTSIADKTSWFFPILTIIFGIIHGLGFGRYFSIIIPDGAVENSLFSFALGVELAQVLIVLGVLVVNIIVINIMKRSRSKWEFLVGAMVLSQAMTMIFERI